MSRTSSRLSLIGAKQTSKRPESSPLLCVSSHYDDLSSNLNVYWHFSEKWDSPTISEVRCPRQCIKELEDFGEPPEHRDDDQESAGEQGDGRLGQRLLVLMEVEVMSARESQEDCQPYGKMLRLPIDGLHLARPLAYRIHHLIRFALLLPFPLDLLGVIPEGADEVMGWVPNHITQRIIRLTSENRVIIPRVRVILLISNLKLL